MTGLTRRIAGITWKSWKGHTYSMKSVKMMIREYNVDVDVDK